MSGRDRSRRRTTALVVILSVLMPGLGHVLLGRLGRGAVWLAGGIVIFGIAVARGASEGRVAVVSAPLALLAALDAVGQMRGRDVPR